MLKVLQQRKVLLESIIKECENRLKNACSGSLHVVTKRNIESFYQYKDGKSTYISRKNIDLAKKLAQKKYDTQTIAEAEAELKAINDLIEIIIARKDVLSEIPKQLRENIEVNEVSDKEYAIKWQKQQYPRKKVDESYPYFTNKGEHVRSKSECIIANLLEAKNVPYHYEKPISLDGEIVQYPDFTVLNKKTKCVYFWEHFGMMDNEGYCNEALAKITRFGKYGYFPGKNLILTFESSKCPLDTRVVEKSIKEFLQ